ncbi:MAG: hypothetical protein CVV16_04055 [Gammaproteobacteria bacterium HGW-Gammaproteobacteria-6]|nr:MAG: hypothetical protein CVV16_04055 [Gammaproteobacteria bacterium HGW-Gammaproteobacteria-6]
MHFTIEGVARRAGVSKGTIYRHFDNAEALLSAVLERQHRDMQGQSKAPVTDLEDLRTQLVELGMHLLDFLTSEQGVRIMRTVIAHGARHSAHGQLIYRDGPKASVQNAANLLAEAQRLGQIRLDDPLEQADQLIGMFKGNMVTGLWMNGRETPTHEEKQRRVESAVNLMLRALRPD